MDEEFVTIEIISERVGLPPRTIRRYTRLGWIAPRACNGKTPLFTRDDAARVRKVARLAHDLGLNVAGIDIVLRLTDEIEVLRRERTRPDRS